MNCRYASTREPQHDSEEPSSRGELYKLRIRACWNQTVGDNLAENGQSDLRLELCRRAKAQVKGSAQASSTMNDMVRKSNLWLAMAFLFCHALAAPAQDPSSKIGREVAIPVHLQDGDEFNLPVPKLIRYGAQLFNAKFTIQEGAGRPLSKGTGASVSDPSSPWYSRGVSTAYCRPTPMRVRVATMPRQPVAAVTELP